MVRFEISTSVTLVGSDLQFIGLDGTARIRFLITKEALKRLAGSIKELTAQQKFQTYDRNREWLHEVALRAYERAAPGAKSVKVGAMDV